MIQSFLHSRLNRLFIITSIVAVLHGCGNDSSDVNQLSSLVSVGKAATSSLPSSTVTSVNSMVPTSDLTNLTGVVVQAGDSIGAGLGADDWAAIDHLGFPHSVVIHNASLSGKSMQTGYGNRNAELFIFRSLTAPSILLIQQGTNDLYYGASAKDLYQKTLTTFVSDVRKTGFYVVVNTILPRTDSGWTSAMEQERISYNATVRTNRAGADAINDLAADLVIGDGGKPANPEFYADGAHPSLLGQQRLASLNAAVLSPLLRLPVRRPSR